MASSRNADLAALQQWIDRCRITYMHAPYSTPEGQHLGDLSEAIHGMATSNSKERIRHLLAIGAFWSGLQAGPSNDAAAPRNVAIGIATEALWSLVVVGHKKLPADWFTVLNNLTDLQVATAVARAMHIDRDKLDLTLSLSEPGCAFGLGRLFDDLADPGRSGRYVNAIGSSYSDARIRPFRWIMPKAKWIALAGASGVVGARAEDLYGLLKDSLVEPLRDAQSELIEEMNRRTGGDVGSSVSDSSGSRSQRPSNQENSVRHPPPRTPGGPGTLDPSYTETPPWQRNNQGNNQTSRPVAPPPPTGTPDFFGGAPSGSPSTGRLSDPEFHNDLAFHGTGVGASGVGHGTSNGAMMDLFNTIGHDVVVFLSWLFS